MANFEISNPVFNGLLRKLETSDPNHADVFNNNFRQLIENDVALNQKIINIEKFETAEGTSTAIILSDILFDDGFSKTFIVSENNEKKDTTINNKPLYKPSTTTVPNLIAGKAVTVWFNSANDCFFIKASAEGSAIVGNVLANKTFSNDDDTGLMGTMPNRGSLTITPKEVDQPIPEGYHNGNGKVLGAKIVTECAQISGLTATVGFSEAGKIQLNWTNPNDGKIKGVRIMYKVGSYPASPTDGNLFYDSNDAAIPNFYTKTGFVDGTNYYIRAFAYTYQNATRLYTTTTSGAQCTAVPYQNKGSQTITSSGMFTVPFGVTSIDIFMVGGGGGGAANGGAGAGSGYTATKKAYVVTPGQQFPVTIGAGGNAVSTNTGGTGGTTSFGSVLSANGGAGGNSNAWLGGNGGSGGGGAGNGMNAYGGNGGSNGSDGLKGRDTSNAKDTTPGTGQGTTTKAFGEATNTLYAGGGGGGMSSGTIGLGGAGGGGNGGNSSTTATAGTPNTGGGGGSGSSSGNGGSGVCIIRWGY